MSELTIKILTEGDKKILIDPPMKDPVEMLFRNPKLLRDAPPYCLSVIKKELKKFSSKSMQWEDGKKDLGTR